MKKNRQLLVTIKIDYDKLMKTSDVEIVESAYCSDEEKGVLQRLANKFIEEISSIKSVDVCIEEEKEKQYKTFERSNKMGSCSSYGYTPIRDT